MSAIFMIGVVVYTLPILFFQLLLYSFRWYELSNRVYDSKATWSHTISCDRWRPLRTFVNECFYSALYVLTWIFGLFAGFVKRDEGGALFSGLDETRPALILIHGYMGKPAHFWLMKLKLRLKGIRNVITYRYVSEEGDITRYKLRLREFILKLHSEREIRDVIFVGHSFGGLIAFDYAREFQERGEIKGVIALGSPFRGSRLSALSVSSLARSLHPTNPLLKQMVESKIDAPLISIYSRYDQFVLPYTNSEHPTAYENIEVNTCGHSGLYFDGKVFRIVFERLTSPH